MAEKTVVHSPDSSKQVPQKLGPSPNSQMARTRSAMAKQRAPIAMNFLLNCSQSKLDNLELARLADVANLRAELMEVVERMVDSLAQAALARWFKENDRETLKRALETEEDAVSWAKRMIRGGGDVLPRLRMDPAEAKAHRSASVLKYKNANIAGGKCCLCPQPLDRNSVRYCTKHLERERDRQREKSKKLNKAPHGRAPGSLAALARNRKGMEEAHAVAREVMTAARSLKTSLQ